MIIVILATMAALLLCTIFSAQSMKELQSKALDTMETDEREAYDEQIKQQVDNVISLCQTIYDQYQAGVYTEAEARKLAADEIRQLRYGDSGYFWVDQYDGTNVVLLGSATEGTNRMETKDANGYQMIKEIIRMGQEPEGGYVDYVFPKEGETESSPKRSYSKAFEPFQWVIGTGNYTDYIDDKIVTVGDEFSGYVTGRLTMFIASTLIEGAIVIVLLVFIIISIVQPLKKCVASIGVMEQGDFSKSMGDKLLKRRDDFGRLAVSLESMRTEMSGLIGEVKEQTAEINNMVQNIDNSIQALDEQIEDVSATTEELAAGMEETAASSEEINAMSHEIESAAKNIATRSQDGATEADAIRELAKQPCIIIGRCASEFLKDKSNVINIYVCADKEDRIKRIMKLFSLTREAAEVMLEETDKQRAEYYYKNTGKTWGDVNNYHMILNTSDLGIENCADILMRYFEMKDYI